MGIGEILIILIVIILIVSVGIAVFRALKDGTNKPINPDNCDVATDTVKDITTVPCCYVNSIVTPFKYVMDFDATLGPNPVYWVQACSGFCENNMVSPNNEECVMGSSEKYQRCIGYAKPRNCKGSAMPVAANGAQLYYINFATNAACPCVGNCDGSTEC